jgi:hypothetical protein
LEVLVTIKEKKKKAVAKDATAVVESKKRKGISGPKVPTKKQRVPTAAATSATSFVSGSARVFADAEETSVENSGGGPTLTGTVAEKPTTPRDAGGSRGAEDVSHLEPSVADPMPAMLGGDSSSSSDTEDAGHEGALPSMDAEARVMVCRRLVNIEVEEVSEDEADSQPLVVFQSATFRPQTQCSASTAGAEARAYQLHLSELSPLAG